MSGLRYLPLIGLLSVAGTCAPRDASIEAALAGAVSRGSGTEVDLAVLASFPWERFYVFPPYSDTARIDSVLGFRWSGARRSSIPMSESVNLLVFVEGRRVVRALELPRSKGDFYQAFRPAGYRRTEARFRVREDGSMVGGAPHYVLIPAS